MISSEGEQWGRYNLPRWLDMVGVDFQFMDIVDLITSTETSFIMDYEFLINLYTSRCFLEIVALWWLNVAMDAVRFFL